MMLVAIRTRLPTVHRAVKTCQCYPGSYCSPPLSCALSLSFVTIPVTIVWIPLILTFDTPLISIPFFSITFMVSSVTTCPSHSRGRPKLPPNLNRALALVTPLRDCCPSCDPGCVVAEDVFCGETQCASWTSKVVTTSWLFELLDESHIRSFSGLPVPSSSAQCFFLDASAYSGR